MTFPEKPTIKDLSDLPENQDFPAYHSSMGGGNMVTNKSKFFSGQGTDSEATHDVIAGDVDWEGSSQDPAVLPGPETPASDLDTGLKSSGYSQPSHDWKELH